MTQVKFIAMEKGNAEDYDLLCQGFEAYTSGLPQRILDALTELQTAYEGYQISRYDHSLQAATRAYRNGEDEEMIVAALVHDIGGTLAPYNHGALAAAIMGPYVSEKVCWIVEHHDLFMTYYWGHYRGIDRDGRQKYRESTHYQATVDFCHHYDQNSFDPDYDTLPLNFFEPIVRKIFAQPRRNSPYLKNQEKASS
jgi:predicted HD phosphohydrolase